MLDFHKNHPDLALVRCALEGSEADLDALFARLVCVRRFLLAKNRRSGSPLDPHGLEDLMQETLLRIWRSLKTYRGDGPLEAFAYRFCLYAFVSALRSKNLPTELPTDGLERVPVKTEEEAVGLDVLVRVDRALRALPKEERRAVQELHAGSGGFRQLAGRLGVAEGTAKSRYYRGLQRLREILG